MRKQEVKAYMIPNRWHEEWKQKDVIERVMREAHIEEHTLIELLESQHTIKIKHKRWEHGRREWGRGNNHRLWGYRLRGRMRETSMKERWECEEDKLCENRAFKLGSDTRGNNPSLTTWERMSCHMVSRWGEQTSNNREGGEWVTKICERCGNEYRIPYGSYPDGKSLCRTCRNHCEKCGVKLPMSL